MRKILVLSLALLSNTALANTYECKGLDNTDLVAVELNEVAQTIGTIMGAITYLIVMDFLH